MRVRRILLDLILEITTRDKLEAGVLAHCIGTSRPRAWSLLRGQIAKFNSETLIDILARLGVDVDIVVTRRRRYLQWNIFRPRPGWTPPPGFAHQGAGAPHPLTSDVERTTRTTRG